MPDGGATEPCSEDIRGVCIVGQAIRHGDKPSAALASTLDERLFQGIRPSLKPLTRAEACAALLQQNCERHQALATTLLAAITHGTGAPRPRAMPPRMRLDDRDRQTPPP